MTVRAASPQHAHAGVLAQPLLRCDGMGMPVERLHQLFVLNVALQLFDGVATYHGIALWGEGNPLLRSLMPALGEGAALLLYKAKACGFLVLLRRLGQHAPPLTHDSLVVVASAYLALSFVPWMSRYLLLLLA